MRTTKAQKLVEHIDANPYLATGLALQVNKFVQKRTWSMLIPTLYVQIEAPISQEFKQLSQTMTPFCKEKNKHENKIAAGVASMAVSFTWNFAESAWNSFLGK